MNQWQFNPQEGDKAVSVVGNSEVVFYIDDLNPEVVAKIVEIYNNGNDVAKVDEYLKDEERCTQDEREFIMEQITTFIRLANGESPQVTANGGTPAPQPQPQQGGNNEPPFTPDLQPQKQGEPESQTPVKPEPPKRTVRRSGTQTPGNNAGTTGKKANPDDVIKQLKEKIQLIEILSASEVPEIPTGLTKASRDIMVEFQERQEQLVAEFMDRIQKM
jgi:hypothetical protein